MHLTRPKSSKGRSRASVTSSQSLDGNTQSRPESPACHQQNRNLCSRSQPAMLSQDEVLQMLQHAPAARSQSLNKYKVLPSIERKPCQVSLDQSMSKLSLSDNAVISPYSSSGCTVTDGSPESPTKAGSSANSGSLLLAVRAPCGRFQQLYRPTDTLQVVTASAEALYGTTYREAFIETMDVPRRTFTDLSMTLSQCGILNRSVLCISQRNDWT
ncbi:UBX domain-containing protein 10 [Pholidichthys leucotaenia]